jgi:DNA-binding response OmpR family regulator
MTRDNPRSDPIRDGTRVSIQVASTVKHCQGHDKYVLEDENIARPNACLYSRMLLLRNSVLADAHILVISELQDQIQSLKTALRDVGCRLSAGFDGLQAYQRAIASSPELILMDVKLPQIDGFSACRLLAADPRTSVIPVIFLTASNTLSERIKAFEAGGVDYIAAPFAIEEVIARVRVHLSRANRIHRAEVMAPSSNLSRSDLITRAAIRHLSNTLEDPPSIAQLARVVGTSEKRLSRAFIESVGKTVFQYLRGERLRLAQKLLSDTALSVASVADEVGFSNGANFATAFRDCFGVTPSTFRNQARHRLAQDATIGDLGAPH